MLFEAIYMIAMVGVVFCNGMVLISQYQLRRNSKTSVNGYVASLSVSAIIFACFFAPIVFTAHFWFRTHQRSVHKTLDNRQLILLSTLAAFRG